MRARLLLLLLLMLVMGAGSALAETVAPQPPLPTEPGVWHTADGARHPVTLELARTRDQQRHGMMGRTTMAPDAGMLFLFPTDKVRGFWMKNTPLPLDLIFLDSAGRVRHIHRHATPHSTALISSRKPVRAVVEMVAGSADRLGLATGDRLQQRRLQGQP